MKKLIFTSILIALCAMMNAQMYVWKNGNVDYMIPLENLDSITFRLFSDSILNPDNPNVQEFISIDSVYYGMYASSEHHSFGQKSFDIANDLVSLDMAKTNNLYGWFAKDAQCLGTLEGRTNEIWRTYYTIISKANEIINVLSRKNKLTEQEQGVYAQALTMRAYCYFNISYLYSSSLYDLTSTNCLGGGSGNDYLCAPYYEGTEVSDIATKESFTKEELQTVGFIHEKICEDLTKAIELFEESNYVRESLMNVDGSVARALLAYTYLHSRNEATLQEDYEKAYNLATDLLKDKYVLLNYSEVLSNGFNSVNSKNWMWGLDVTSETSTGLASFFGHLDRFTYGYAWAGDIYGIDANLYESIPESDVRKQWFDAGNYSNLWKFYDLDRAEGADNVDREWVNDLVYMRIEEMYLIAAEAAWRMGDNQKAIEALKPLLQQRDSKALTSLSSRNIKEQIYYNWRVEMWGEGRSLMTLKRFDMPAKVSAQNHLYKPGKELDYAFPYLIYQVPGAKPFQNVGLTVEPAKIELGVGTQKSFVVTTYPESKDAFWSFTSSDNNIVNVSNNFGSNKVVVRAVAEGNAVVTVGIIGGYAKVDIPITVTPEVDWKPNADFYGVYFNKVFKDDVYEIQDNKGKKRTCIPIEIVLLGRNIGKDVNGNFEGNDFVVFLKASVEYDYEYIYSLGNYKFVDKDSAFVFVDNVKLRRPYTFLAEDFNKDAYETNYREWIVNENYDYWQPYYSEYASSMQYYDFNTGNSKEAGYLLAGGEISVGNENVDGFTYALNYYNFDVNMFGNMEYYGFEVENSIDEATGETIVTYPKDKEGNLIIKMAEMTRRTFIYDASNGEQQSVRQQQRVKIDVKSLEKQISANRLLHKSVTYKNDLKQLLFSK